MSIGYACQLIGVTGSDLSRCTLKYADESRLKTVTEHNLKALDLMIDYNIRNQIKLFRISSDIIPFGSHPVNSIPWWEEYKEQFNAIGEKIKRGKLRVSMHPGQYTVLNSSDEAVVRRSMEDLIYHDRFLDALGLDQKSKMVLHIGGVYGNKEESGKRFVSHFAQLPDSIKGRLILENDDKNYTVEEVLKIASMTGSPVVFDNLHHALNPSLAKSSEREWILECKKNMEARRRKPENPLFPTVKRGSKRGPFRHHTDRPL